MVQPELNCAAGNSPWDPRMACSPWDPRCSTLYIAVKPNSGSCIFTDYLDAQNFLKENGKVCGIIHKINSNIVFRSELSANE